jgi:hypothetical protein
MKAGLRYLFIFILLPGSACFAKQSSQSPSDGLVTPVSTGIKVKLRVSEDGSPAYNVIVKISRDTVRPVELRTMAPDGWTNDEPYLMVDLEPNCIYSISFSKPGYVSMLISLDTHIPADLNPGTMAPAALDIKMLKLESHPELVDVDFPLALLVYDRQNGRFVANKKYAEAVKMQLKQGH